MLQLGGSRREDDEKVCWLEKSDHLADDSFVFPFAVSGCWVDVSVKAVRTVCSAHRAG